MSSNSIHTDFRDLVVGINTKVPLQNGTYATSINFDNAATTPAFLSVLKEISKFSPWYSSIHRGKGYKSMLSSEIYENGRKIIKNFVNADPEKDVVIYTKNTTDSINILSNVLSQQKDGRNIILSTWMEHASNDLPWREKFYIDYIDIDSFGRLSLESLESKLRKYSHRVKLVAVTGASNVTGYINPIHRIAELAHRYGAQILVDGAQLVPHMKVDMKPFNNPQHIDYLAFSSHKMYAPFGGGVLIGPKDSFKEGCPYCQGGSAIKLITHKQIKWEEPPQKDEAGTPNLMGVIALTEAIKTLTSIGMDTVYSYEKNLHTYALNRMKQIPDIKIYSAQAKETIGVIPFNMDGVHHQLMSAILSFETGISVRNGFFCSHPYCQRLLGLNERDMTYYFKNPDALLPGIVRISFGIYNNYSEIDRLIYALGILSANKNYYIDKYSNNRGFFKISNDV